MAVFPILLGFLACAFTCFAFGITALRLLHVKLPRLECACLGYVVGGAITSTLTLAIALAHLVHRDVSYGIALLAAGLLIYQWRWFRLLEPAPLASIPPFFRRLFAIVWIFYGVLYFRNALAPETSPDGVAYHLGEVNLWFHAHGMIRLDDMYATLSQGMEMLYLFAFTIGHHSSAALMHFSLLMILPVIVILYGVRFGITGPAAVFAAVVFFTTPLIGWDGSIAYNDVALAAATFATIYFVDLWRREKQTGFLVLAAFVAGFAVAIKYTGVFVVAWLLIVIAWELRRNMRLLIRTALAVALIALILPAPYFIRNWIWYGDPVGFFATSAFRNPNFHVSFEREYLHDQANVNDVQWRDLPRELTIGGTHLPDSFGPIYILAPLALAGLAWPKTRWLLAAVFFISLAYPENKAPRFLIPAVPLVFLAVGMVVSRIRASRFVLAGLTMLQAILCWPPVVTALGTPEGARIRHITWDAALRREPEDHYLTYHLQPYLMARRIDKLVPEGETVFALGGAAQAYTTHFVMDTYRSANTERIFKMLYGVSKSDRELMRRWTGPFPATAIRELRITQLAVSPSDWTVSEIRLWSNGRPVPMPRDVHADAFPNPWDAKFAADGNGATSWRSWEGMSRGMWIDLRFDTPPEVDRVDVVSHDTPWEVRLNLRIRNAGGQSREVDGNWYNDPAVDDRANATAELKREGIRYVVIDNQAFRAGLFNDNPAAWGMSPIAATTFSRLYRID